MVVVPQLCGHKQVLTSDRSVSEQLFERRADLRFVAITFGGVEVAEPHLDRGLDGISRLAAIGKRRPKPERRNLTAAVVQRKSALSKILVRCHGIRPPCSSISSGLVVPRPAEYVRRQCDPRHESEQRRGHQPPSVRRAARYGPRVQI